MPGYILRIIYYLVLAFAIGTLAQMATGYRKRRLFTTFVLGFIGVFIGDFVANRFNLPDFYIFGFAMIWSILGAVIFILLFRLIRGEW